MDQLLPSWVTYPLLTLTLYTTLCQALRFRRIKTFQQKYSLEHPTPPDSSKDSSDPSTPNLSTMTSTEASTIQKLVSEGEFPSLFEKGLQLALFRTYGIPTIAKLLNQTTQLLSPTTVAKRYADTTVLLIEMYENAPTSQRSHEAFARLNYLHGHYIKQGKITNDDMLYTLALFMNHPVEWINRYEWRQLTPLEICGLATFHKEMGDVMHISYEALPSYTTGWRDGLHFYEELDTWCKSYEERTMLRNLESHKTAQATKDLFLSTMPRFMHGIISQVISASMDDRLREAVMFPPAHPSIKLTLDTFMAVRRFLLRYLFLPRLSFMSSLSKEETAEGRRYITVWGIQPHYVRPTFWARWGPLALFQMAIGAPRPGDEGMCPGGYLRKDVGPKVFEGKGRKEFEREVEVLRGLRTGGCPFGRRG